MDPCGPDSYYYWIRWTSGWLTLHILGMFAELFLVILFIPVRNAGSFLMDRRVRELADADRTSFGTPPKCPLLRGLNWKVQRRKS